LAIEARAETITVTVHDLQEALNNASQDSVSREMYDSIAAPINSSGFSLVNGELLYQDSDTNITVEDGCNRTVILKIDTEVSMASDSSLSMTLDSLYDPVVVSLNVSANIVSSGLARQIVGIRLGSCQNLARDSFDFDALGPARFTLQATLELNPEWTSETTLSLFPRLSLSGELLELSISVNVDDTILASILETFIEDRINETFTNSRLGKELQEFERTSNEKLTDALESGRIDIELPEADDAQVLALYQLLQPNARFPISLEFIRRHRQQILAMLLFGAPGSIDQILSDAAACQAGSAFFAQLNPAKAYEGTISQCTRVVPYDQAGDALYTETSCSVVMDYQSTGIAEYCDVALDPQRLGNAASFASQLGQWTHSAGSRLDIGALTLEGLEQPLMQRFNYKTVETARGTCDLEMRVYSPTANGEPRKALLALHGGSWQHRASGFLGIESTATHFTNEGFIVFAPFYRLVGETDGNIACNNASLDAILADVHSALDWVSERQSDFNVIGRTTLFGQSAGGHLALSLATYRSEQIDRAILFYPPTDFADFALQIKSGDYQNETGLKILEAITGSSITSLDMSSAVVRENSFPDIILNHPDNIPPMFILHGEMDSLLPARQSVRLCNALAGSQDLNDGVATLTPNLSSYAAVTQCGTKGSQMHLIAEGEHALDLCVAPELCLAGSPESANAVADSILSMLAWSTDEQLGIEQVRTGSLHWYVSFVLLLGLIYKFAHRLARRFTHNIARRCAVEMRLSNTDRHGPNF